MAVGVLWAILTAAFELGLGRATGLGWDRILADYDVLRGGLMPLGLLAMVFTPWAVWRLQRPPRPSPPGVIAAGAQRGSFETPIR